MSRPRWGLHIAQSLSTLAVDLATSVPNALAPPAASHLIARLCEQDRLQDALALFYASDSSRHDPQAYAAILRSCARLRCLADGAAVHRHLQTHVTCPDLYLSNHLISFYAKCDCLDYARQLFDQLHHRNLVSWTALISGYDQNRHYEKCFRLFVQLLRHHLPNDYAMSSVLGSRAHSDDLGGGRQVHCLAIKTSLDAHVHVGNALITMYSNCSKVDGDGEDEWLVFLHMPYRNLVTWNSMIAGSLLRDRGSRSLELFTEMLREGIGFDGATLVSVLSSCLESDPASPMKCRQLHSIAMKSGFVRNCEIATSLVKAYSTLEGEVADCYRLFLESNQRDIVSWTGMMTSLAESRPEEAVHLFCRLRYDGLEPDQHAFSIVIKACAGLATERHGSAIHTQIVKSGFEEYVVLANALIHAYSRCGALKLSECVFYQMNVRDVVSWNSMIKGYAIHGSGNEALHLFVQMKIKPDSTTFVGLLSACAHAGLVAQGQGIFNLMWKRYGVAPQYEHLACMVDILGRAGHLSQAERLIEQAPIKADAVVWSALLGASKKHGEIEIAERAAQKLIKLEPKNSVAYVIMSNVYFSMGSFENAGILRRELKEGRVKKEPGLSWIEVQNHVHEFASGGRRHPQREVIYRVVEELVSRLREIGYVPETSLVFHEMEEQYREERLLYHSEKLALAYGLMMSDMASASSLCPIKIMKNIRICLDCHNFMKLASSCIGREIVVRDANRFHHFRDGECSCSDYW